MKSLLQLSSNMVHRLEGSLSMGNNSTFLLKCCSCLPCNHLEMSMINERYLGLCLYTTVLRTAGSCCNQEKLNNFWR